MKKILSLILISGALLSACNGCNSGTSENKSSPLTPEQLSADDKVVDPVTGLIRWNFKTLDLWPGNSQAMDENGGGYRLTGDTLRFETKQGTYERPKVGSIDRFTFGKYTWRVYVPMPGKNDQTSVGAFIYFDDQHEVDFEIGHGKEAVRIERNAGDDEVLAYMTSQDYPWFQEIIPVKAEKWYDLSIELKNADGKYKIIWSIDDKEVASVQTVFGDEIEFKILCSLENLKFIGDGPSSQDNYCLFDYVEFLPGQ